MVQAIFETGFDALYLTGVLIAGIAMVRGGGRNALVRKFGLMAIVLGAGDAFHLIPRVYALWTTGLEANAAALGIGKLITSVTMTVFYLILYYVWRERYAVTGRRGLTVTVWTLAAVRVGLSMLAQNEWLSYRQPLFYGILRNIPFAAMGVLIIVLFARSAKAAGDREFRWMWPAVLLSFALYLPVVLLGGIWPPVGMLMVPKTLAYVWIVAMGWKLYQSSRAVA